MIIAVPYENGLVFGHFGHTKQFRLYTVEDGTVTAIKLVTPCGGAKAALAEENIRIYGGVSGDADRAVAMFLAGKLEYDPHAHCDHHDHDHSCADHDCGGSCHHD